MESPFDILRIDPDADDEEIERAYRRRAKETHPDQGGSAREFRLVISAYEEITTESARAKSDSASPRPRRDPASGQTEPDRPERSRVEYLDYEVLDDYGWTLDDDDLFEKASTAGLDPDDYGRIAVESDETLLQAAENRGFTWPFSCRGGACANCAVAIKEGELSQPVNHVLPEEMVDRGIRLSCMGAPITDELRVVYNVKYLPDLDELRLPPGPFKYVDLDD